MTPPRTAGLTLGPLLFNWEPDRRRDFYFRIADEAPVGRVHLGEVVCSKRIAFTETHLSAVIDRLTRAGKEVVLSSLALVMTEKERAAVSALCADSRGLMVEANDVATAAQLTGRPHVLGPFVNIYNEGTLAYLAGRGAVRVCLPAELPGPTAAFLAGTGLTEIELQAFGRLPLALSARCYHARANGLHKDGCQYVCGRDPDGMDVDTMEGVPFLTVNGTQTMSRRYANLLEQLVDFQAAGVASFRLWPQSCDMVAVAGLFAAVLEGSLDPADATRRLAELVPAIDFANGYALGREGHAFVEGAVGMATA